MRRSALLAAVVVLAALRAPDASAQSSAPSTPATQCGSADSTAAGAGDVVIRASVRASELRFDAPPGAHLTIAGCAPGTGLRVVERRNLPGRVEPGVTYRDVYVAVEIVGRLNAACIAALAGDSTTLKGMAAGGCTPSPVRTDSTRAPPPR